MAEAEKRRWLAFDESRESVADSSDFEPNRDQWSDPDKIKPGQVLRLP